MPKRGISRFSFETFLVHSTESFRRATLLCFKKFRASKIVRIKRVGGFHDFPSKLFCLSTESFRGGTLLCFKRFRVSKNVMDKRGSGFHDFPSKLFCLSVPNHFVEEPFCVSKGFGYRKMLEIREEVGFTIFRQTCFVSQYRIIL